MTMPPGLQEVQARTAEIIAQLQSLVPQPAASGPMGDFGSTLDAVSATSDPNASDPNASDPTAAGTPTAAPGASGQQAVSIASSRIGTPYVWGGDKPGGFDCSGLVQWTYGQMGVHLPRTAAEQGRMGTAVSVADAQPGDLVYFNKPGRVDHIGIYAGNGEWVVAPHTGSTVRIEHVDLSAATSIRRIAGPASGTPAVQGNWVSALPAAARPYAADIAQAASQEGVDPRLLASVAWTESGFRSDASSGAGALGIMQLMPATARGLGVDPLDPAQALVGGARYLKTQLDRFGGRADLALAAYNAGPTAVRKAGGIPPYPETQAYVTRVLDRYRLLGGSA